MGFFPKGYPFRFQLFAEHPVSGIFFFSLRCVFPNSLLPPSSPFYALHCFSSVKRCAMGFLYRFVFCVDVPASSSRCFSKEAEPGEPFLQSPLSVSQNSFCVLFFHFIFSFLPTGAFSPRSGTSAVILLAWEAPLQIVCSAFSACSLWGFPTKQL